MLRHVIVSGGTGVTGNALVRLLVDSGVEVSALVRPGSQRKGNLPMSPLLHTVECGMDEYFQAESLLQDKAWDAFFHLAWDGSMGRNKVNNRNNMYLQLQNVKYMLDAVELCGRIGCPLFVATGSQAEYGVKQEPICEETVEDPQNGYGIAKLCAGRMSRIRCRELGIRHVWIRLFSIYGPYDGAHSMIDTGIKNLREGKSLQYTPGEQLWDYLYSADAARAIVLLAEKGSDGETYCVAAGHSRPLYEYIREMHEVVAPDIKPLLGAVPYGPEQVMRLEVCTDKLQNLGFEMKYTFMEGIRKIYEVQMQML